jgi:hypothetical protein
MATSFQNLFKADAACLGLIEAAEEPGSHLAKLFEVKVVPLVDDEGL